MTKRHAGITDGEDRGALGEGPDGDNVLANGLMEIDGEIRCQDLRDVQTPW